MNKKIITAILIGMFIFTGCNLKSPTTTENKTPTVEFQDKILAGSESAFYEISVTSTSITSTKLPINFNAQKNFVRFEGFLSSKSKFLFVVKPSVFEYLYVADLDGSRIKNLTEGLGYENMLVYDISPDENWVMFEAQRNSGTSYFYVSNIDGSKRYNVGRSDLTWFPHFSKDSSKVIFGKDRPGGLAQIGVLDLNTGESNDILNEFKIKGSPQRVEFLNDSKILFAAGPSLYVLDNGKLTTIPVPDSNFVWSFKILSNGKVLCESNNNQNGVSIYLYDETLSKEPVKLLELKDVFIHSSILEYSNGREFLGVYGGADNKSNLYLFDEKNERILNLTQNLPKGGTADFCFSGDKSTVFFVHTQDDIQTVYSVSATGTNLVKLKEFDKSCKGYGILLYPFKDSKNLLVSADYISEGPTEHKYDFKLYLIDTIKRSFIELSDCEAPLAYVKAISPSENTILISPPKLFTMNSMKCNNLSEIVGKEVIDAIYLQD